MGGDALRTVTVGLSSHQTCITDEVLNLQGLNSLGQENERPPTLSSGV